MSDRYYWSDQYNNLPAEVRLIGKAISCADKINSLNTEKARLGKAFRASLKEINETIKYCEIELMEMTIEDKA